MFWKNVTGDQATSQAGQDESIRWMVRIILIEEYMCELDELYRQEMDRRRTLSTQHELFCLRNRFCS